MEPQQPSGLSFGGPGSTAEVGNRVSSIDSVVHTPNRGPACKTRRFFPRAHGAAAAAAASSTGTPGYGSSRQHCSSLRSSPLRDGSSSGGQPSSSEYTKGIPNWRQDAIAFDLEAGCIPWTYGGDKRFCPWLPWTWSGSDLERKARDPASFESIGYNVRPQGQGFDFLLLFLVFFAYCFLLSVCHRKLEKIGLYCRPRPLLGAHDGHFQPADGKPGKIEHSLAILWAETLVTTGACFLLAQGYYGIRAARERMERVRQTTVTLAYSFMKTTSTASGLGHGKEELELLIYECLALLTAYPVALLEQMRGNTCEPDITRYCQDTSRALKRLRDGDDTAVAGPFYGNEAWFSTGRGHRQFATVEYFFEVFSLQLQIEFSRQAMRTKTPAMTSQHILYNLRNHFENFVDLGNLDDRRTPIIRENIDMLGLAGRECGIFSSIDVTPVSFLWAVRVAGWLIAFYSPIQNCNWIIDWIPIDADVSDNFQFPSLRAMVTMAVLSILSALLTAVLAEMWKMWDPFGKGTNTHAWTLGIATEIDNMLNEFYEYDTKGLIRKHAYMEPSACLNDVGYDGSGSSGSRAQTV